MQTQAQQYKMHIIYNPNRKGHADVVVHVAGCGQISREVKAVDNGSGSHYETELPSMRAAADDFYSDFIGEGSMDSDSALAGTELHSCAVKAEVPVETPGDEAPAISKGAAKQDLARRVILAISLVFENADGSEAFMSAFGKDEAAEIAAAWVHHLPTGRDGDGKRWWGGVMPRPGRSDWRE